MIRHEVAKILGVGIPPKGFHQAFRELERSGSLDQRKLIDIVVLLLNREEAREKDAIV